jgi:Ca2+-binding EF-hand superfamily protein
MKNADDMLKGIVKMVDTNGDGRIQYEGRLQLNALAEDIR